MIILPPLSHTTPHRGLKSRTRKESQSFIPLLRKLLTCTGRYGRLRRCSKVWRAVASIMKTRTSESRNVCPVLKLWCHLKGEGPKVRITLWQLNIWEIRLIDLTEKQEKGAWIILFIQPLLIRHNCKQLIFKYNCGDGRTRTAVQTPHRAAFYTLSYPLIVGHRLPDNGLPEAYPLNLGGAQRSHSVHPVWMIPRFPTITGIKVGGILVVAAALAARIKRDYLVDYAASA